MSEVIKSIDIIFKLLPKLKGLTGERRQTYFEKVILPLYKNVESTHGFYIEIIDEFKKVAMELDVKDKLEWSNLEKSYDTAITELESAKTNFANRRESATGLRFAFRAEAKEIFEEIKWKKEKEFVLFVMLYFNGEALLDLGEDFCEAYINMQFKTIDEHELGAVIAWDSPSAIVAHQICDVVTSTKLIKILDHHLKRLNVAFSGVQLAFNKVNREIVLKT